jgi:hypothetical protein
MAISRWTGPILASGSNGPPLFSIGDGASEAGPSAFAHGVGLFDTRFGNFAGADTSATLPMWYGAGWINVLNQAPSTLSATNIAAAQVPVAATPLTLAGASTGITVVPAGGFSIIAGQVFPAGALMIDGNPAVITLASLGALMPAGGLSCYDPRTMVARRLIFTSVGDDHLATVAIVAVDMYGYTYHETVTLANATTTTSLKAAKAVISITPAGTLSGSNLSVGTTDVYEFPLAVYQFPFVQIYWNNALISSSTGFTAAVTTSPATATTGDVRGVYATQSASDGTKLLQVFVAPSAPRMNQAGLFGVQQF